MRRALPSLPIWIAALGLTACAPEGPSGFVTFNIPPNMNCEISAEGDSQTFLASGVFDIAISADGRGDGCAKPYRLSLLVNSFLRPNADMSLGRAEPNILQIHSAQVRLLDIQRSIISFDQVDPPLPNPFLVTTNNSLFPTDGDTPSRGIAVVEAIPEAYARQMNIFVGQQIFAEVQIFGTTTGDVDVEFKPFVYPIEICDGCLTVCYGSLPAETEAEDVCGDDCCDNAGADGRVCIDFACTGE